MASNKKENANKTGANPYINARREWNERYGSYISQAKNWRILAFLSMGVAIVSLFGVIFFASQNKLIPYVVEVNGEGKTVDVYKIDKMAAVDQKVIRAQIATFIRNLRTVSSDMTVQRAAIEDVYAHLSGDAPAYIAINEWFKGNVPFERAKNETVSVDIRHIMPLSDHTWRIEWIENRRLRNGEKLPSSAWTAIATVATGGTVDSRTITVNPIGLFIKEINWSENH